MDFFEAIEKRRAVHKFTDTPVPDAVVQKALDAALLAPNSSDIQPWEFYWVKSPDKKAAFAEACLGQNAARTASQIVVAVSRIDTWRRNRQLWLDRLAADPKAKPIVKVYYERTIPLAYTVGPLGLFGLWKRIVTAVRSRFAPVGKVPLSRADLFEVMTKSTSLACQNLMMAIVAQGYGCCPMEGFDDRRVRQILGLSGWKGRGAHIIMVIGIGETNPAGIYGPRVRFDRSLFVKEI